MHKKVLSIFAAAMVLSGLFVVGTIAPAAAQAPFGITNFHPTDDPDANFFVDYATILSDRFDGTNTTAHLTAVATTDTDRVSFYHCPLGVAPTITTQAELATCVLIQTDTTATTPAGGAAGAPVDEAYDVEWNIPVDLDGTRRDIASLACVGAESAGNRVVADGGLAANCLADVEADVSLEDGQNFQGATDANSQTSAAEIVSYCTSDVTGGPSNGATDICQVAGVGAGTTAEVAARFKSFPHGSSIPNDGFVFRATADPTIIQLGYRLYGPADSSGISATNSTGFILCGAPIQAASSFNVFECTVTTAQMTGASLTNRELNLILSENTDVDGAGYCDTTDVGLTGAATPSDPDGADSAFCQYDAHYVVSNDRRATTTTFSWAPASQQPAPNVDDGSPATNAGCDTGETPDNAEDQPISIGGTPAHLWGTMCVRDQFNNPLSGANVTFESTGADPGAGIVGCAPGEALPAVGAGDLHDEHGPTTSNNQRFDDCHTTTDASGEASVRVANTSTGTAIVAKPGVQTITGCVERQYLAPLAGDQTNQPTGHGCADELAGAKATGTVNWLAIPDHIHFVVSGTGGTNPCHNGDKFRSATVGQTVDLLVCTQVASASDTHVGATTNQPGGGRITYAIVGAAGGQLQIATRLLNQPNETDANGLATLTAKCEQEGTDTITASLRSDTDTLIQNSTLQVTCVAAGQPTIGGTTSPSGSPGTTTTAPGTTGPPTTPKTPRTISLEVSRSPVSFGKPFALTGGVSSSVAACATGVTVTIRRTVVGQSSQDVVDTLTTNSDGTFSVNKIGDKSAQYIASVDDTGVCAGATSTPAPVLVKVKVILKVSDSTIRSGQTVTLKVATTPCDANHAGTKVTFFKSSGGSFAKFASKTLSGDCRTSIKVRPGKDTAYQARYAKQDDDHLGGKSRKKAISVRR